MSQNQLFAILFALGWVPLFYFRVEAPTQAWSLYSPTERFWVRWTPIIISVHITLFCSILHSSDDVPWTRLGPGLLAFVGAILLWFWGRQLIGPLRETRLPTQPPIQFRQDGAFHWVRHPLYSSYLLLCTVPVILLPRWYLIASFLLCAGAIARRAEQEEQWMHGHLGEAYEEYCQRVKRLIPYIW